MVSDGEDDSVGVGGVVLVVWCVRGGVRLAALYSLYSLYSQDRLPAPTH